MLSYILIVIIAYLLGNISTSYIIAKKMMGVDIRDVYKRQLQRRTKDAMPLL